MAATECPLEWKFDGKAQKGCANPDGKAGSWCPTADGYNPSTLEYIAGTTNHRPCNCTSENGSNCSVNLSLHVFQVFAAPVSVIQAANMPMLATQSTLFL